MILGAALLMTALLLFLYNQRQSATAGQVAESLLSDLENWMQEQKTQSVSPIPRESVSSTIAEEMSPAEPSLNPEMPVVELNGYAYVGYLEIPALELKLPVLSDWDYNRLLIAPCRQHGSSRTDDLVIAAHNFQTHFGQLSTLSEGDTVSFTDMDNIVNLYAVAKIDTIDPYDVGSVLNSEYDLVLYTCTVGGKNRLAVFCNREKIEHR